MIEYPKIYGPFKRDERGKVQANNWTNQIFEYLLDNEWRFWEKIDGTNIRIMYQDGAITFAGRTNNAILPSQLVKVLESIKDQNLNKFQAMFGDKQVCFYGEGFGGKIQKGHLYGDMQFALFDVVINNFWLSQDAVSEISEELNLLRAPEITNRFDLCTLRDGINHLINNKENSMLSASSNEPKEMEGFIAYPYTSNLFDQRHDRVVVKLKTVDLYGLTSF